MATIEKSNAAVEQSSKYSEDWVPIKNIMNGMIQLDNGYYVTGIKVSPKNIFILDNDEREAILFNLQNFYNMLDYEFCNHRTTYQAGVLETECEKMIKDFFKEIRK